MSRFVHVKRRGAELVDSVRNRTLADQFTARPLRMLVLGLVSSGRALPADANGKPNGGRRDGSCNSAFPLGGECRGECDADGCRLGADGRGDLAGHGRPAHRAALAGPGGRAVLAGKYEAIRLVGPLLGRPAVGRGAIREWAGRHREHAPGAQPSVKVWLHDPIVGRIATIVAGDRAQRIGRGVVVESYPQPPRGP